MQPSVCAGAARGSTQRSQHESLINAQPKWRYWQCSSRWRRKAKWGPRRRAGGAAETAQNSAVEENPEETTTSGKCEPEAWRPRREPAGRSAPPSEKH